MGVDFSRCSAPRKSVRCESVRDLDGGDSWILE